MTTQVNAVEGRSVGRDLRSSTVPDLLDVRAVTELLGGCSTRHVYRLADAGRMPSPLRLGALVRWRRAELQEWITAGCPSPKGGARRP